MASLARLKKRAEESDDAEGWYRFGVAAAMHDHDEAIDALRTVVERDSTAALAAAAGQSLESLGDLEGAELAYRRALELDAGLGEAYGFLGALLVRLGRKEPGLRALGKWADLAPDPPSAHLKLAMLLIGQDDHANAANHLQIAVTLDPHHPAALRTLGAVYERLGNREGCLRAWRTVHALEPNDPYTAASYGAALSGVGRHKEAIEVLSAVAQRSPPFWELDLHLGRALREAGQVDAAVERLAAAARRAPNVAPVQLEIGRVLESLDRPAEAAAAYERAIEMDPRSVEGHHRLGLLLSRLGRTADAQRELVQASALAPDNDRIQRALAGLLEASRPEVTPRSPSGTRGTAKKAIEGTSIGGSLSVVALPDLIQFLNSTRATGTLTVSSGQARASIRFSQGNLHTLSTPTGSYTDEAGMITGLIEILRLAAEAFDFDHTPPTGDVEPGVDPRFVLMQAMQQIDEARSRE